MNIYEKPIAELIDFSMEGVMSGPSVGGDLEFSVEEEPIG